MFCRRLRAVDDVVERKRENARLSFLINNGDVLNPLRHSASVVQKSPGVAARLISTAPARVKIGKASSFGGLEILGPLSEKNTSGRTETRTRTPRTTSAASSNPTAVDNRAGINYDRRSNMYDPGQSPATIYPERARSSQPGLSWLGDDEFESTGLAFRLARLQRVVAEKPTGHSGPRKDASRHENPGSRTGKNDEKPGTRVKVSNNGDKKASWPKRDTPRESQPKQAVLKPSPIPKPPAHVDIESTDFTSLFGASPSLPAALSPSNTRTTPTDDASRRVQLALEYRGGDYSRLVSSSLVTSQGGPLVYAESTMARRRGLGSNRRNDALAIVQGMVVRSPNSQPTA